MIEVREPDWTLHWILRVAVAACFVGHGAFGIITKAVWVPYFAVWGIPEPWAWRLMPVVGLLDISIGVLTLLMPIRAVLLWMVFWGVQTAALRPLSGEPIWEFFERAGNFGVPLALLRSVDWPRSLREWFLPVRPVTLSLERTHQIAWILRVTTAALLIGHGGFGAFMHKADWAGYFAVMGVERGSVDRMLLIDVVGWFEIALGFAVLAWPWPGLLLFVFLWKIGIEWLRPMAGEPFWEFIERGGSYAAPLGLLWLEGWPVSIRIRRRAPREPVTRP